MRKIVALGVALGLAAVLGSVTLVKADCAYHKAQTAINKADTSKETATMSMTNHATPGQVQTAQSDKPAKPVVQTKN